MIERDVIVRLHSIVERLNNVLERNLISEYKKQHIRISSSKKTISKLLKIQPILNNLACARTAKEYLVSAKKHDYEEYAVEDYLRAATIVYDILCELSSGDSERVLCGVRVSKDLNAALKQAIEDHPLWEGAREVYQFVNENAPTYSWGYDDYLDNHGIKIFELVKSEDEFIELLKGDYREITGACVGGIRVAFKSECLRVILPHERTTYENQFKKIVGGENYEKHYKTCIEILYPSTLYKGTYQIYVPVK